MVANVRRLCLAVHITRAKAHRPHRAAIRPICKKRPRVIITIELVVRAVVVTLTVKGISAEPLTLSGEGVTVQAAAVGAPEHVKVTDPKNPFAPVTARL
jgi:hypothetical protein